MKKILLLLVLSVISVSSLAQVFSEEENERIDLALSYSDNGREDEAIAIYDELIKKHPDVSGLKFEKAYCYYQKQDYKNAYKTLKPTLSAPDANPQYFAVAGNAQDMMGKPKDALKTYQAGLEKFPDSGYLHLETGNVLIGLGYTAQGVGYYEHGIEVDPGFASNYYRAAQYLFSDYPIKSIIYAETHNLIYDPNGPRWPEVSKLLYDAYNENIHFEADTVRTTFSRDRTITIDKKDVESGASPTSLLEQMSRIARELSFSDAMNESVDAEALKAAGGQLTAMRTAMLPPSAAASWSTSKPKSRTGIPCSPSSGKSWTPATGRPTICSCCAKDARKNSKPGCRTTNRTCSPTSNSWAPKTKNSRSAAI